MSYNAIANMARNAALRFRVTACASTQAIPAGTHPSEWTDANIWWVVAAPGWADKWLSAIAAGIVEPGADEAVITDGDILSSVQGVLAR